ncbi:MAG: DUF131 domain-containing protein [Candidatus Aenigmarchaeota archaeon]|nr:DUF131 domain-containing protein [Candidatus Aenigmarchaeota archaeon]
MPEINFAIIGFLLIIIGIVVLMIGAAKQGNAKIAVGGFIGPIPFGWANDSEMMKYIIIMAVIVTILFVIFLLRGIRL